MLAPSKSLVPLLCLMDGAVCRAAACRSYKDCGFLGQRCVRDVPGLDLLPHVHDSEGDDPACASGSLPCSCAQAIARAGAQERRLEQSPGAAGPSHCESRSDCGGDSVCYDTATMVPLSESEVCSGSDECSCGERCERPSDCLGEGSACVGAGTLMALRGDETCDEGPGCFCGAVSACSSAVDCSADEFCFDMDVDLPLAEDDLCSKDCICLRAWAEGRRCNSNIDCSASGTACYDAMAMVMLIGEEACAQDSACYCGSGAKCAAASDCFEGSSACDCATATTTTGENTKLLDHIGESVGSLPGAGGVVGAGGAEGSWSSSPAFQLTEMKQTLAGAILIGVATCCCMCSVSMLAFRYLAKGQEQELVYLESSAGKANSAARPHFFSPTRGLQRQCDRE